MFQDGKFEDHDGFADPGPGCVQARRGLDAPEGIPTRSRLTPYVFGSAGLIRGTASVTWAGNEYSSLSENDFVFGGGAGLNTAVTRRFGLRFEARLLHAKSGGNIASLLAGIYYRFGGRKK